MLVEWMSDREVAIAACVSEHVPDRNLGARRETVRYSIASLKLLPYVQEIRAANLNFGIDAPGTLHLMVAGVNPPSICIGVSNAVH